MRTQKNMRNGALLKQRHFFSLGSRSRRSVDALPEAFIRSYRSCSTISLHGSYLRENGFLCCLPEDYSSGLPSVGKHVDQNTGDRWLSCPDCDWFIPFAENKWARKFVGKLCGALGKETTFWRSQISIVSILLPPKMLKSSNNFIVNILLKMMMEKKIQATHATSSQTKKGKQLSDWRYPFQDRETSSESCRTEAARSCEVGWKTMSTQILVSIRSISYLTEFRSDVSKTGNMTNYQVQQIYEKCRKQNWLNGLRTHWTFPKIASKRQYQIYWKRKNVLVIISQVKIAIWSGSVSLSLKFWMTPS